MIVFVDTGVLGLLSSPNDKLEAQQSITQPVMRHAAQLWAMSRHQGMPTADDKTIDNDVIIAAQCQLFQQENLGQRLVIATTNVKHLSRFLESRRWQDIRF
ncbi:MULTISPECIES: hypothetical protein [Moorena]|uniref:PIN domain-containing protein n=1 Tax=Moorena producens 3L TaxID=489825 RepID=F4XZ56_9CYAN|nr:MULTISPECIES: hypothetical protein [Moorena]EGJ30134.1 hypothetical protein LYNGBM3L_56290 [Moorena producens 3L]NEP64923.1 type II toxin-antitoxin system VapC family toxin [Moorena sp. SIO3A5]NEQ11680.1 type II toxin-antitoxin system VapC family toxin [Moorena sp. SIO4E2]OLT66728.1 hypothetical protein BI334_18485 [Moorena producens 3L]